MSQAQQRSNPSFLCLSLIQAGLILLHPQFIALHRGYVSLGFIGSKILKARLSTSKRIMALFIVILTL